MAAAFSLHPWNRHDQDGVVALISGIQRGEFGLSITPEDQPDLMDVPGFYQRGAGQFWVARAQGCPTGEETPGSGVIGCIALLDIGNGQAALRKMFVEKQWRGAGHGVASALLAALLQHAAEHGLQQIFLGTTTRFLAAHRFYEKNGFIRTEKQNLPPSFPVMAVDTVFYRLPL